MRFDLVLFDLDGTLVDSVPDIARALNHALAGARLPPLDAREVRGLVGDGVVTLVERALALRAAAGVDADALARRVVAAYRVHPCVETRVYPGVEGALRALGDLGVRAAVVTNKPGEVARPLLAALGLEALFTDVVGDGDGFARKPAPDAALALADRAGVPRDRVLVVGDGLPDVALARAVGCPIAAAAWGYTDPERLAAERPDYLLAAPGDLLDVVRS